MKSKEKLFLNNVDITRDVQNIEITPCSFFKEDSNITLKLLYRKAEYILQIMSYALSAENLLEYQYYDEKTGKQKTDCYYFRRRCVELTTSEEYNYAIIEFTGSEKSIIDFYIDKIDELEEKICKLKEENIELKEDKSIFKTKGNLPPRIPIGESSSKEDVKQKKDFMDIFFHIALISSWFVLLAKCLLGV